jgi:hypothetical protein
MVMRGQDNMNAWYYLQRKSKGLSSVEVDDATPYWTDS